MSLAGSLRLWDRASGRAIGPPLDAFGEYTRSVVWFGRQHLLTASFTGELIDGDMVPAHWASRACAPAPAAEAFRRRS